MWGVLMGCIMLLGEGCTMGAGPSTTIISDTFADNADLNNRLASPVNVPGSRWGINGAVPGDPAGDGVLVDFNPGTQLQPALTSCAAVIDCQHSDGTVQCDCSTGNNNDVEVFFRSDQTVSNFWHARWDVQTQTFSLDKFVGGVFTAGVASTGVTLAIGTHTIKVVLSGNSIIATIDGAHQISTNDADLVGNTFMGFGAGDIENQGNGESFTNFKFTVP